MLSYKLQKIKEYLKENLKKKFITLSKASFASSILFVEKKDDNLCFCINYQKLNALIKRDWYSILLIDELLAWIQDSKYLTWLDIIIMFNKLHMSSKSEDLTTFVTFFNVYKYRVMLFELINESAFFQHYINDVLFNCKLTASSRVLEFKSSTRLVKTWFKSEFLTWVFKSSQDVQLKYLSQVRELRLSINLKFSTWLVKTWR